ncbi:flavin monoamine oxidase family protein [Parasphingorhabdus cellanae]|uniref:FAD-dependent oxidoreductase n=1 Tax=Parasphingorhabdus cellanae TaxID=2806553 RepID=A0ABX7T6Q9_9SPHN|nr:NAD(P)/FAD-dependent oxidoreductase [Parasphingorhabdus cellanae]QTD56598.1 FAD-dependent oxidoreductase [Parasphingorhabdus cellanae]
MHQTLRDQVDVVIVGAGMSGLSAAARLDQANIDFCLIEAQNRVGGRIETEHTADGEIIEHGAQALNTDMQKLFSAVTRSGLHPVPLPNIGRYLCDGASGASAITAFRKMETLFEKPNRDDAELALLYNDPQKSAADRLSLLSLESEMRSLIASQVEELWGLPMHELQFSHAVDIFERYDSDREDWEFHVQEGLSALATSLAEKLGDRLVLQTPVQSVDVGSESAVIDTVSGSIKAKAVIVAAPPTIAKKFMPPSHWSQPALKAYQAGDMIKMTLCYDRPFWRDAGNSGMSSSISLSGFATADTSLKEHGKPRLTVFIGGPNARHLAGLSREQRWERIQQPLVRLFGAPAANPVAQFERIWVDDPWVGGGYNAHVIAGQMLAPDVVLRKMEDRVTFACSEIATQFPGYVEGAIHEGQQAAGRIAHMLGFSETAVTATKRLESSERKGLWSLFKQIAKR